MSGNIADILSKREYDEPPEIAIIKQFMRENYQVDCKVNVNQTQIIISVTGASLAGTLRMRLHELQKLCKTKKRLVIRIN